MRWSGGADELDLERAVEAIACAPVVFDDVWVRERTRVLRSVVLVVDVSASVRRVLLLSDCVHDAGPGALATMFDDRTPTPSARLPILHPFVVPRYGEFLE